MGTDDRQGGGITDDRNRILSKPLPVTEALRFTFSRL